jgi:hypothetical protein
VRSLDDPPPTEVSMWYTPIGYAKIVAEYAVELEGWPEQVPFRALGRINSKRQVELLRAALTNGTCRWVHLSTEEIPDRIRKYKDLADSQEKGNRPARGGKKGSLLKATVSNDDDDNDNDVVLPKTDVSMAPHLASTSTISPPPDAPWEQNMGVDSRLGTDAPASTTYASASAADASAFAADVVKRVDNTPGESVFRCTVSAY